MHNVQKLKLANIFNNYVSFIFHSLINRVRILNLGASRIGFTPVNVPQLPLVKETEGW